MLGLLAPILILETGNQRPRGRPLHGGQAGGCLRATFLHVQQAIWPHRTGEQAWKLVVGALGAAAGSRMASREDETMAMIEGAVSQRSAPADARWDPGVPFPGPSRSRRIAGSSPNRCLPGS